MIRICLANLVCGFMAMGGLHPVWLSSVPIILDSRNSFFFCFFFLTSGSQQHRDDGDIFSLLICVCNHVIRITLTIPCPTSAS